MNRRSIGRLGREVSEISFGAWQIGEDWSDVAEEAAMATLHSAADAGVTFFDTADVYGDGRSERLVGRPRRERPSKGGPARMDTSNQHRDLGLPGRAEDLFVPTKMGRRLEQTVANYSPRISGHRRPLAREPRHGDAGSCPLHCPPTDLYYHPRVFEELERTPTRTTPARRPTAGLFPLANSSGHEQPSPQADQSANRSGAGSCA